MKIPERTLQYIYDLDLASKLIGRDLLDGKGKRALDVGTYKCHGLLALKALGYEVYGFDINPEAVNVCRKLGFKNVVVHNLEKGIPFNTYFDLVTCFGVLEHVRDLKKALKRLLKVNWRVMVITVPNLYTEFLRLAYLMLRHRIRPSITTGAGFLLKDPDHINMYGPTLWLQLLDHYLKAMNIKAKLRLVTYMQIALGNKAFYFKLPIIGSSIMITIVKV